MRTSPAAWLLLAGVLVGASGVVGGAERQTLTPLEPRPDAPDFSLVDMDGARHRLSDLRGHTVIVNFWATWCPPCRDELPSMERAYVLLGDADVAMLAINVGEDEEIIFPFTANYPVTFPLLLDHDGSVVAQWPVRGLPTTYVVDPAGRVAYQAIGGREWDDPELLRLVRGLGSAQ